MVAIETSLIVKGIVALVTGLAYAYVARIVLGRRLEGAAMRANRAFATWWVAFGIVEFVAAAYNFPAAFGVRDLPLSITTLNVLVIALAVALGGLVYFLVYLYTGSARAFWPVVAAYCALAVALLYLVAWMDPTGFSEDAPGGLAYARHLTGAPSISLGLAISLPVVLVAIGYGSLYFKADSREARYRIAMVSVAFGAWFGWSMLGSLLSLSTNYPGPITVVNDIVALAAPFVVILAYRPPRWVRTRLDRP